MQKNASRSKKRGAGFRRTSALLEQKLRNAGESRGFAITRLLTHWSEIVGAPVAEICTPVKVSYAQKGFGATLVVLTTGPQAQMTRDAIATASRKGECLLWLQRDFPHPHHPNSPRRIFRW